MKLSSFRGGVVVDSKTTDGETVCYTSSHYFNNFKKHPEDDRRVTYKTKCYCALAKSSPQGGR